MSPILDLQRRMRELGRIRIGAKGAKGAPVKLETFRLTSPSEEILRHASGLYGGVPNEWADAPGEGTQYELVTETAELDVYVVPQDIADQQTYELWSGGGCLRRCDGAVEQLSGRDCICDPENRKCKPTTHLLVMLPQLPDVGVWRLVTHGWNAANELPGTVEMLRQVAGTGGMPAAVLAIEHRTSKAEGKTHHFSVPVLRVPWTLAQAQSAGVPVLRPSMGEAPALPADPDFTKDSSTPGWGEAAALPTQVAPIATSGGERTEEPSSPSGTTSDVTDPTSDAPGPRTGSGNSSADKADDGLEGTAETGRGGGVEATGEGGIGSPVAPAELTERDAFWAHLVDRYKTEARARNAVNRALQTGFTAATITEATAEQLAQVIEAGETK